MISNDNKPLPLRRILDFENLGFGLFVHFGLYSVLGMGEWAKKVRNIPWDEYMNLFKRFNPKKDWANKLVCAAKDAGCRYITLTTRHHDGFSLFDTCGLNDFDAPHACGRDIVAEFVNACRIHNIIPFFYHTLLDWHEESYNKEFKTYLNYLRNSVEILCKNYGKIGGIWFDGMWDKRDTDWEEDALYSLIRKWQPDAMIINNTGLRRQGALGHIELDSVTFERGRPKPINMSGSPKYIASEMCEVFSSHWGYAKMDFNYKSVVNIIESLAVCRRYRSNFLLNIGPMADGSLRTIDKGMLEIVGDWVRINEEAIHKPIPTDITIEDKPKDFILRDGNSYYLFVHDLKMVSDKNVALEAHLELEEKFVLDKKIKSVQWLDNNEHLDFVQENDKVVVHTKPFFYGESQVIRIAKILT